MSSDFEISSMRFSIGAVNTLVRRPDGSIFGDNTDAYGFEKLIARAGNSRFRQALSIASITGRGRMVQ